MLSALGVSHPDARGLAFVPLVPALRRDVVLMQRGDRPLRPAAQALADAIVAALHPTVRVART